MAKYDWNKVCSCLDVFEYAGWALQASNDSVVGGVVEEFINYAESMNECEGFFEENKELFIEAANIEDPDARRCYVCERLVG